MKNILLPTDFSENSRNAILYALEFFKGTACSFYILNVHKSSEFILDDMMAAPTGTSVYQTILKDNKKQLSDFLAPLKELYAAEDYKFLPHVDFDALTDSIHQLMEVQPIDLIIMGSNGATGAKEILFGSNTLNVIRNVDAPLLVIPEDTAFKKLDVVLFTGTTCQDMNHSNVEALEDILKFKKPRLHFLELKENQETQAPDSGDWLEDVLDGYPYSSHTLRGIPAPVAVDAAVQLFQVDMHAMFIERATFLERFFFGNKTAKISYATRVPLLVLHKERSPH